ncbi:uracil-DNA glycosylase family protein [Pseudotamlana agarivorans]|uniref:uracil-DNA glycosylase family protein n=1 Tax=Pseudotamlana agarivorans TaxID=481183 RepID=UPI0008302196|nr:uracil-DNA glycosylase family protein [Tamlana agarivorans]
MTNSELQSFIINKIKTDVINLSDKDFEGLYNRWFNNNPSIKYDFKKDLISKKQGVPNGAYLLGVDLPYWFGDLNASNKKIMVIGIDPLRAESAFNKINANKKDDVLISTPYALHSEGNRNEEKNAYWAFINELKSKHFVYLTDIYKTFFYINEPKRKRSYVYNSNKDNVKDVLRQTLYSEIEFIKPDVIITFGGIAYSQLMGKRCPKLSQKLEKTKTHLKVTDDYSVAVLPFMHLSGSTRSKNLDNFLEENNVTKEGTGRVGYGKAYAKLLKLFL